MTLRGAGRKGSRQEKEVGSVGRRQTGDLFRFVDADGDYSYNVGLKNLAKGTYKLTISEANSGASHDEWFSIK